jgi:hypothetical protein
MKILSTLAAIFFFTTLVTTAQTPAPPAAPKTTVIHAGHLIAEPGKPATTNLSIVIESGKITAIKDGFDQLGQSGKVSFVMKEGQVMTDKP